MGGGGGFADDVLGFDPNGGGIYDIPIVGDVAQMAKNVLENPLQLIETVALTVAFGPAGLGLSSAAASALTSAAVTAANGGSIDDVAKAAIGSLAGAQVGGAINAEYRDSLMGEIAAGASKSVTEAAIRGTDLGKAFQRGVAMAGWQSLYGTEGSFREQRSQMEDIRYQENVDSLNQQIEEASAAGDTELVKNLQNQLNKEQSAYEYSKLTPEERSVLRKQQLESTGLGGGLNIRQALGLKAPELTPLPPAETIGVEPIDYGKLLDPISSGIGLQSPKLKDLPPAEQIGTKPIDYKKIFEPETPRLPSMGGGTGLTTKTPEGETISGKEPSFADEFTRQVEKTGEGLLIGALTGGGTTSQPKSTSTLSSTGLFTPQSIIPSGISGIAPIARGKPILGGEDEEATGAWGAKTLRA